MGEGLVVLEVVVFGALFDRLFTFDSVLPLVAETLVGLLLAADDKRLFAISFVSFWVTLVGAEMGRLGAASDEDTLEAVTAGSPLVAVVEPAVVRGTFGARLTLLLIVTAGFVSTDGFRRVLLDARGLRAGAFEMSPFVVALVALVVVVIFGLAGDESLTGGLGALLESVVLVVLSDGFAAVKVRAAGAAFAGAGRAGAAVRGDVSLVVVEDTVGFLVSSFGAAGRALVNVVDGFGDGFDGFAAPSGFLMTDPTFLVSEMAVAATAAVATAAAVTALAVTATATALGCVVASASLLFGTSTGATGVSSVFAGSSTNGTGSGSTLASDSRNSDSSLSLSMVEVTSGNRSL